MTNDSWILAALLASGCAIEAVPTGTHVAAQTTDCPKLICGNAAQLAGQPWFELDETGEDFSPVGGFRIKDFRKGGVSYQLVVDGFHLHGISSTGPIAGQSLLYATILIESELGSTYELRIDAVGQIPFYEGGAIGATPIPTYEVTYRDYVEDPDNQRPFDAVCPSGGHPNFDRHAIIFQGDRYDSTTGELVATGDDVGPWFNFTCNDDALWKLALMRHVEPASVGDFVTTEDERMAGLRAIRADYCGDSTPHTVAGTAVDWRNRGGWLTLAPGLAMESRWEKGGATCLDNPRYEEGVTCNGKKLPKCWSLILTKYEKEPPAFITKVPL